MQTFLPFADYSKSAAALDYRRLGKQRVEVKQILRALTDPNYGWRNHPAVLMWQGHEHALVEYGIAICIEWRRRGYKDSLLDEFIGLKAALPGGDRSRPEWLTDPRLTRSHQSNLIRKDAAHYGPLFPNVPDDIPYFWPSQQAPLEIAA